MSFAIVFNKTFFRVIKK